MKFFYKLDNPVKHYRWGSPVWIPRLLGKENPGGEPWAELWMGTHPGGPSKTAEGIGLDELTGGGLPFLFKLLAAEKPLSIQAHPNLEQARTGWERENRAGLPLDAADRNYKDPNHKPEILCALSSFKAMCGFREMPSITRCLERFAEAAPLALRVSIQSLLSEMYVYMDRLGTRETLKKMVRTLLGWNKAARAALSGYAQEGRESLEKRFPEYSAEWQTMARFAALYPEDAGILSPLYLNLLNLAPGEAVFLPAGVLHAYIEGFGVELMANSDNVLRGGLTEKHVDGGELERVLNFAPFAPAVIAAPPGEGVFTYPAACEEFSLSVVRSQGGSQVLAGAGPRILVVTEGRAVLGDLALAQGESVLALPVEGGFSVSGNYTLYAAGSGGR